MRCRTGIMIKLSLGTNNRNSDGTRSCKFTNLKIALLDLFEIFLYYSKNEKHPKLAFSNEIDATFDQIYNGYLLEICINFSMPKGRFIIQNRQIPFFCTQFLLNDVSVNDIETYFCTKPSK